MFLGGPNPSNSGFLSIQMKVVENTKKQRSQKYRKCEDSELKRGQKWCFWGPIPYDPRLFIDSNEVVGNPQKRRKS